MRQLDLDLLEKTFQLMETYLIDEVATEEFTIKKSKFKGTAKAEPSDQDLLARHLEPSQQEPWESLPQEVVDAWATGTK